MSSARVAAIVLLALVAGAAARNCTQESASRRHGGGHKRGDSGEHVGRYPITAETADACKSLCDGEPACLQYVFHVSNKNCYRLNRVYEDADNNDDFVSGRCKREKHVITNPRSCYEAKLGRVKNVEGTHKSGIYTLYPDGGSPIRVFCDQKSHGGGWAVIQKRVDATNFQRTWAEYVSGFGTVARHSSYWLGLENIHRLTKNGGQLRIELTPFGGHKHKAEWSQFSVGGAETSYTLTISGYNNAKHRGLGQYDSMAHHNGRRFSTYDRENNPHRCSNAYKAGWWYGGCHTANLNGIWRPQAHHSTYADGPDFYYFGGYYHGYRIVTMKVKSFDAAPMEYVDIAKDPFWIAHNRQLAPASLIPMTGSYTWMFWMRFSGITWHWGSILRKGNPQYYWERNVGIWNWPGTTKLCIVSGIRNNWNWYVVSSMSLPINRWVQVTFAHDSHSVRLYLDGTLDGEWKIKTPALVNNGPLLAGDMHHWPAYGQLADVRYKGEVSPELETEITETMAKFVQPDIVFQTLLDTPTTPSRGATIGKPHADSNMRAYTYMFWIKASGVSNGFTNIMHHGHASWQNNIGVYMYPGTTWLYIWSSHPWHWWQYAMVGPLVVNEWTHLAVTHQYGSFDIYINGKRAAQIANHQVLPPMWNSAPLYLSDPWYAPASNVQVDKVMFATDVPSHKQLKRVVKEALSVYFPTKEAIAEARRKAKEAAEAATKPTIDSKKAAVDVKPPRAITKALSKIKTAEKPRKVEEMPKKEVPKKVLKKLYKKSPKKLKKHTVKSPKVTPQGGGKKLEDPKKMPLTKKKSKRRKNKKHGGHGYNKGWLAGWMAGWREGTVNNQQ